MRTRCGGNDILRLERGEKNWIAPWQNENTQLDRVRRGGNQKVGSSNLSGRAILKPSPRCIYAAMASGWATPGMWSRWLRHDVEFHCIRVSSAASIKPWPRRGSLNSRILPPSPTMRMRKHSPRLTKESRTLRLSGLCLPRKSGNACASGLPDPVHGKGAIQPQKPGPCST